MRIELQRSLWRFALAKTFRKEGQPFQYEPNRLERVGSALRWGVGSALDITLREIRNPVVVLALTALAMVVATAFYYPVIALGVVHAVVPFVFSIKLWMIKLACYIAVQSTLLGVGMRTVGRLLNEPLVDEWNKGLEPVYLGDKKVMIKG